MRTNILPPKVSNSPALTAEDVARHDEILRKWMALPDARWKDAGIAAINREEGICLAHSKVLRKRMADAVELHEICNEVIPERARKSNVDIRQHSEEYNQLQRTRIAELLIVDPSKYRYLEETAVKLYPQPDYRTNDLIVLFSSIAQDPKRVLQDLYHTQTPGQAKSMEALAVLVDGFTSEMIHMYAEYSTVPDKNTMQRAKVGEREESVEEEESEQIEDEPEEIKSAPKKNLKRKRGGSEEDQTLPRKRRSTRLAAKRDAQQ